MAEMKAAVTRTFGTTRVEEVPRPAAGPGEAVIRVEACGVCSGEGIPWYVNRKVPTVLGHEVIGTIAEVGEGVRDFARGHRVFAHHHVPCGECHFCRRGHTTSCRLFRESALDPGGFAEFVRVPAENLEKDTLIIPPGVSLEEAIFLEPLACSVRGLRRSGLGEGDSVLLIGAGAMGLLNLMLARRAGAAPIIVSDFIAERREAALGLGAAATIDPADPASAGTVISDHTEGRGVDVVIVGPGTPGALSAGLDAVAPGGTVLQFTPTPEGETIPVPGYRFWHDEITLTASYSCGPEDTREALAILAGRELPLAEMVTARFGLDGVDEAMRLVAKGGGHLKSVIYPGGVEASRG